MGVCVFFPTFILEVNTTTDCHLIYEPCGRTVPLLQLDYAQPKKRREFQSSTVTATPKAPVLIADDSYDLIAPRIYHHMHPIGPNDRQHLPSLPIQPLVPPPTYSVSLDQDELIQSLFSYKHPPVSTKLSSSSPLLCMSENKILDEFHHSGLSPPPVRLILPMHNASKTNSHWTSE